MKSFSHVVLTIRNAPAGGLTVQGALQILLLLFTVTGQFPSLSTWCRTFNPLPSPPVRQRSTRVNVYRIDGGRSVRVRSMGYYQFSNVRFNSRGEGECEDGS